MFTLSQKLKDRITTLYPRLEAFNEESLQLVTSLGRVPPCARVTQLLEIKLFDVSTLWHSANLKVSKKNSNIVILFGISVHVCASHMLLVISLFSSHCERLIIEQCKIPKTHACSYP